MAYREHKFESLAEARAKANKMRSMYGYTPQVFQVRKKSTGKRHFAVIEPDNLTRL